MIKQLLTFVFAVFAMTATAQGRPQPEGKLVHYNMKCYDYYVGSFTDALAVDLVFSEDGKHVYISSLFPTVMPDAWHTGTIEGDKLVISSEEVCFYYDYYGTGEIFEMHIGQYDVNESGVLVGMAGIEMIIDGDRFYLDDNPESPDHIVFVWSGDPTYPAMWAMSWCFDLTPAEVEEENVIPETATLTDYVYYAKCQENYPTALKGTVAVDGDDYYFTHLTNPTGVLKGKREGDKVVLPAHQYIGRQDGFVFYAGGYASDFEYDDYGYVYGKEAEVTFTIGEDGSLTLDDAANVGLAVVRADEVVYSFNRNTRLETYTGDVPATPKNPYNLTFNYYEDYGQYGFFFALDNLDVNGKFLNPDKFGYYVYFDEDIYEFTKEMFDIDESMYFVPYGFTDNKSVSHEINFYGHTGKVWLAEDLFNMIGVQAVYIVDGETRTSDVISIDEEGNLTTNFGKHPAGVDQLNVQEPITNPSWYDLNGRRMKGAAQHGVYIVDGKVVLK